ncbi:MAG TPA: aromatic ring-hydroxylating dioxygenase subunit alpha [Thermoleophilaceae bacterium]|nr:aromatic ring-hydroxylating dioxygenase subunit alpha [Thermoleophilaceae bacterium]
MKTENLIDEIADAMEGTRTLPPHWYVSDEILRLEKRAVFEHGWQFACHVSQVAEPGDQVPVRCGDVPVVVVRDREGELRAFINVCRHRGHEVVLQRSNRGTMQCRYHGWNYGLDGCLRAAPRERREVEFHHEDYPLLPAAVDVWGSLVFVNPDPEAAPLADTVGTLDDVAAANGLDLSQMVLRDERSYDVRGNWKIALDNMLECYHCPTGHPGFYDLYDVDPATYVIQLHGACSYQRGDLRAKPEAQAHKSDWGDFELYYVWPNTIIIPGPVSAIVMPMVPVAPNHTIFATQTYFSSDVPEDAIAGYLDYYDEIWREDVELIESVQRGQAAQRVQWGPLLTDSEKLLQHVQGLLLANLRRELGAGRAVAGAGADR